MQTQYPVYINNMNDIKVGDYVRGTVATYSQKYLMQEGYEQYNRTLEGVIIHKGKTFDSIIIITPEGDEEFLIADPGTSGYFTIELITKD